MMRLDSRLVAVLLGTAGACAWQAGAVAADMPMGTIMQEDTTLPAVSGINGKWEFDPGILTGGAGLRALGSLSAPLGDRFGVQADGMASWSGGTGLIYGGALHAFTRDPSRYLLGVTGGIVVAPGKSTLTALGAEGELYMDRVSFEGWAGVAALNYVDPKIKDIVREFIFADVSYYPTDDTRLILGARDVLGDLSLHAGAEYLFHGLGTPLSITGDARLHAGGNYSLTVGLKGYFGGNDNNKSLIDRRRQDDPDNRALDLFEGSGDLMFATAPTTTKGAQDYTDQGSCTDAGFHWWEETATCHDEQSPEAACLARDPINRFDTDYFWYWTGGQDVTGECHNPEEVV